LKTNNPTKKGEPVYAWCGPQPNSRLLLNYGIVDEGNPHDRLPTTVTLPAADPLYKLKRDLLQAAGLSTMQTFDKTRAAPLPPLLLPYLRLAFADTPDAARAVSLTPGAPPADARTEALAAHALADHLAARLAAYRRPTVAADLEVLADPASTPRQKVAARLVKIEKSILQGCVDALGVVGGDDAPPPPTPPPYTVKLS
jgi:histone-lysine N-methyltransferase SETD3